MALFDILAGDPLRIIAGASWQDDAVKLARELSMPEFRRGVIVVTSAKCGFHATFENGKQVLRSQARGF